MVLTLEQFKQAANEVERIISLEGNINLKDELSKSAKDITDKKARKEFYRHMNALFLNILLNRLDEVGVEKEERAFSARNDIVELINAI
jgi:lipoate-protein ligase A